MFAPETLTAPAPIVKAEVFATFPCRVTVPVSTVKAVVRVAFVTVAALPVQEAALPVVFWFSVGTSIAAIAFHAGIAPLVPVPV